MRLSRRATTSTWPACLREAFCKRSLCRRRAPNRNQRSWSEVTRRGETTRCVRSVSKLRLDFASHLQPIARTTHKRIQPGHQKDADQQAREQPADAHQRKRPLRVGAHTSGRRDGHKPKRGHECRHHDRSQPQDGGLANGFGEVGAVAAQLLTYEMYTTAVCTATPTLCRTTAKTPCR